MKIETLKDRIKKAEEKIAKLNRTLDRHKKQLIKKAKKVTDKGVNLNDYDKSEVDHETSWDIAEYEWKLEDIRKTEEKINETSESLKKYKEQLKNQLARDKETENLIPEVLNIFLENWKQKCIEFYTLKANKYIELKFKEYEVTREELEQLTEEHYSWRTGKTEVKKRYTDEQIDEILKKGKEYLYYENVKSYINYRYFTNFKKSLFASDLYIIEKIIDYDTMDSKALNKILDEDVKDKKETFIKRIKEVIGEIKDLTGLEIGSNGEINGIAIGTKAKAKVETISAGGYNIQCWHYRVLVNTVK